MVRGLEIGVNDYLMRPIDKNELLARARSQVRKRRYTERLRDNVQISIEMAITDALTGLFATWKAISRACSSRQARAASRLPCW
jgi:PleD family two-component response regulator